MSEYMIELRNVTKRYGDLVANDDVTLKIRRGELMTLLGPSGCGKTTTLLMVAGIYKPTDGIVQFDERVVTSFLGVLLEEGLLSDPVTEGPVGSGPRR